LKNNVADISESFQILQILQKYVFLCAYEEQCLVIANPEFRHGQHLGILFKKRREFWKREIPLDFTASIENKTWKGVAVVPWDYLPVGTDKFNIYAIHGQGTARWYEALFPVPTEKFDEPDL